MALEKWYCFRCNEEVVEADIAWTYLETVHIVRGLKCAKCGAVYLTEEQTKIILEAEGELEAKMQ